MFICSGDKSCIQLVCQLDDKDLPTVPHINVTILQVITLIFWSSALRVYLSPGLPQVQPAVPGLPWLPEHAVPGARRHRAQRAPAVPACAPHPLSAADRLGAERARRLLPLSQPRPGLRDPLRPLEVTSVINKHNPGVENKGHKDLQWTFIPASC